MGLRFVLLVLLIWPATGQAASYGKILRQFEAIAFSDEGGNYSNQFKRWPTGRHIRIRIESGEQPSELLLQVLDHLTEISGISMTVAEPANVSIEYVRQGCRVRSNGFRATIQISKGSRLATAHCTLEELTQLVGPGDDACHYRPSIFCDSDFPEEYTEADRIILRATFDRRMRVGMTREEGMPIARQIIRELYEQQYGPITERNDDDDGKRVDDPDAPSLP
ncbi:MAG: DUF2927 domain-containing protein [Alphaproteobacteria bacterium]|nr:DUF2927 domain-containing protein [Alphaproteobacteria bacterium]